MNKKVNPGVFFAVLAILLLAIGTVLYRKATEPLYFKEPDEEMARQQFNKPKAGGGEAPAGAPKKEEATAKDKPAPKAEGSPAKDDAASPDAKKPQ